MSLRILIDVHHHALLESLHMLFADRFGAEVWCPWGMDWFESGVWQHEMKHHGDAVARQYLEGIWAEAREVGDDFMRGTITQRDRRHPGRVWHGTSYLAAKNDMWDLVISSLPDNDEGFAALAKATGARFGVQVGNNLQFSRWDLAEFILASSTLDGFGPEWAGKRFEFHGVPTVMYHQEFSLDTFRYEYPPAERRTVASFVNCFPEAPSYPDFLAFARVHLDEFDFKVYGACGQPGPDEFTAGDISLVPEVAERMRAARVGVQQKHWSDGYGHVIHNWGAVGRPIIGYPRYYADKLASPLWVEGVTSWDVEGRSYDERAAILRRLRDDDDFHRRACETMRARFDQWVDFDHDADEVALLLGL